MELWLIFGPPGKFRNHLNKKRTDASRILLLLSLLTTVLAFSDVILF